MTTQSPPLMTFHTIIVKLFKSELESFETKLKLFICLEEKRDEDLGKTKKKLKICPGNIF